MSHTTHTYKSLDCHKSARGRLVGAFTWLVGVASLVWACGPLQGTDCRVDGDCEAPQVCQKGWCLHPTKKQPITICPAPKVAALRTPVLLSKDHEELGQAASNGRYLYWTDRKRGHLARQPVKGGAPELLHEGLGAVYGLLLDGNTIYLTKRSDNSDAQGAILKMSTTGKDLVTLRDHISSPKQMVQGKDYLYWNVVGSLELDPGGTIVRLSKKGGEPKIIAREYRPYAMAIDDTHLYWVTSHENGALRRLALNGKHPTETLLSDLSYARDIAVDKHFVYYLANGLYQLPKAGGEPATRLSPGLSGTALKIDDHFAYIATGNGLRQIPLHCTNQKSAFIIPTHDSIHALAMDANALYLLLRIEGVATTEIFRADKRPKTDWQSSP